MSSCPRCSAALTTTSSSAVSQRTLERPFKKRLLLVTLQSHPKVPTLRCQASGIRGFPTADVPLASIDVEFAHFLNSGKITTAAAEVCLLRDSGAVLLHSYISPDISGATGVEWIGGVGPEFYQGGASAADVQSKLVALLQGCVLVGYGLNKDLIALGVTHPSALQKDLVKCSKFQTRHGQARKLQDVVHQYLGQTIQAGKHSAREDAYAAMQLYQMHVKNDPELMTYQELIEHELRKISGTADRKT